MMNGNIIYTLCRQSSALESPWDGSNEHARCNWQLSRYVYSSSAHEKSIKSVLTCLLQAPFSSSEATKEPVQKQSNSTWYTHRWPTQSSPNPHITAIELNIIACQKPHKGYHTDLNCLLVMKNSAGTGVTEVIEKQGYFNTGLLRTMTENKRSPHHKLSVSFESVLLLSGVTDIKNSEFLCKCSWHAANSAALAKL